MRESVLTALAAFALAAPLSAHAAAAGCKLQSVDVPVTVTGQRAFVSAKIAGKPIRLVLDSGAFYSSVDAKFATDQQLKPVKTNMAPTGSHIQENEETATSGVAGRRLLTGVVSAPSFEFAGAKFGEAQFMVHNFGAPTGLLGQNFLHGMDDDYDLKNAKVRLIDPVGCGGLDMAYWVKPGEAYSEVAIASPRDFHTSAIIQINGVKVKALFDTGAPTSFITERAALRTGVKTTDPGVFRAGHVRGVDEKDVPVWVASFASVKIGDEEIKNTKLSIGDSEARDFDVLLGADFFLAHHVYVANSQGKIYFTYAGGPVFRTPGAEEAGAGAGDKTGK